MFNPKFKITKKILSYLTEIAEARAIILNSPIVPKWEINLRKEALLKSTHASTSIEGNLLSIEEVSELMIGRDITARSRDKDEVLNYFEALNYIDNLTSEKRDILKEADILDIHKIITKGVMGNEANSGSYRKGDDYVVIANKSTGEIIFKPPLTKEVPNLMKELVKWLNDEKTQEMNSVIEAGILHYEFVRIHPFIDGNGRTARALATLIMIRSGFDTKRFFALDDFYNSERSQYYDALKTVDPNERDLTQWLEYFCEGVSVSIKAVEKKVKLLVGDGERRRQQDQIAIGERQMMLVEYVNKNGKVTNKEVREMLDISNKTAYKILDKLVKQDVFKRMGKGRGVFYILK